MSRHMPTGPAPLARADISPIAELLEQLDHHIEACNVLTGKLLEKGVDVRWPGQGPQYDNFETRLSCAFMGALATPLPERRR